MSWLSDLTWNNGWSFLVPYAALFLVAWGLDVPLVYLIKSFLALHSVVVVLLLFHLLKKFRARELFLSDLFFLGAFFLFLFIPGVYLEFPSDPWGHFQRITMWQHAETVDDYPLLRLRVRFSYFLDWSVLSLFSVIDYRKGLSLIAALQQLFVAVQLFRLARAFGLTKGQSYAATVLFFVSFGTVLFSVRYYALSSFMLAFGAYLAALVLLIERFKGEKNCLWGILPLTVIIVLNHPQELLFLFMLTSSLMCLAFFRKYWSARLVGALILGLVLVYGSAFFFFDKYPQLSGIFPDRFVSPFGMVNIFAEELGFNRTLGLFGWVSLLLAFLVFKRLPLLALCSLTPICFLLFPPAVIVLGQVLPHPSQIYRLLYAFPLCIVFVAGIVLLLGRLKVSRLGSSVSLLVGILLTVYPYAPVHGRLAFSVFAPPAPLELEDIDRTADTLSKLPLKCLTKHPQWIVTDVVSFHALAAFLGWQPYRFPDRRSLESLSLTTEKLKKRINSQHYRPTCAVLLYEGQEETHPESKVAQASGHWYQQHANRSRRVSAEDRALVEKMYANWTKRSIPGSYLLYLPPEKK